MESRFGWKSSRIEEGKEEKSGENRLHDKRYLNLDKSSEQF